MVEIRSGCLNPTALSAQGASSPDTFNYGVNEELVFTLTDFTYEPSTLDCDVEYICKSSTPPAGFEACDLCSLGSFDSDTLTYTLSTIDKDTCPPSDYSIEI